MEDSTMQSDGGKAEAQAANDDDTKSNRSEDRTCVVCWVNKAGIALQPCGHDHFCDSCSVRFRTCPLCRAPLVRQAGIVAVDTQDEPEQNPHEVMAKSILWTVAGVAFGFWLFIFFGGAVEWMHDLPRTCEGDIPVVDFRAVAEGQSCALEHLLSGSSLGVDLRTAQGCYDACFADQDCTHFSWSEGRACRGFAACPEASRVDVEASFGIYVVSSRILDPLAPEPGETTPPLIDDTNQTMCKVCSFPRLAPDDERCDQCHDGYINGGWQCYENVAHLPPVKTAAALGGTAYFAMIVLTQVIGASCEVILIWRMRKLNMLPNKELWVLAAALLIEVARMLLVDIFVLQDYFGGREYRVFHAPVPCEGLPVSPDLTWFGADGGLYCRDWEPHGPSSRYYIATSREAYAAGSTCPTYTTASALLDYSPYSGSSFLRGGHPRYSHLGWVIGGEFAMFYLFATFVNEVADNIFVVPTTTQMGMQCKIFSVALELFQLGALCPAAIFVHGDCLQFMQPLGVSLHIIRDTIVWFGYCMWGLVVVSIPLAGTGLLLVSLMMCVSGTAFTVLAWPVRVLCGEAMGASLERRRRGIVQILATMYDSYTGGTQKFWTTFMLLSFLPLLLVGMFLGVLVVVGQASKSGVMQMLTALVLLSDVLFKVLATLGTELAEYLLHLRVRRAVERGGNRRLPGVAIGRPAAEAPGAPTGAPASAQTVTLTVQPERSQPLPGRLPGTCSSSPASEPAIGA